MEDLKDSLKILAKGLLPGIVVAALLLLFFACTPPKYDTVRVEYEVVDSVWIVPPGHTSTMQFDPMYYYKTESRIYNTRCKVRVGDTIYFKYIKVWQ